jgi:hypothetical protein
MTLNQFYPEETRMKIPEFAATDWYSDPRYHRCPHDAWLEILEVKEIGEGERQERRSTAIVIKLLGAYHDSHIVLRYTGVRRFACGGGEGPGGVGDWLQDEFTTNAAGLLEHRITWANAKSEWFIEMENVSYEWIPMSMKT